MTMKCLVTCPLCSTETTHDTEPTGLLTCKKCKLEYMYNPDYNRKRKEITFSSDSEDDEILPNYKHQANQSSNNVDDDDDDESEFDQLTSEPSKLEFDFDQIKSEDSEYEQAPSDNGDDWDDSEPEQVEEEKVYKKRKAKDRQELPRKKKQRKSTSPIPNAKLPNFEVGINFDDSSSEDEQDNKRKPAPKKKMKDIMFDSDSEEEEDYESTPTPSGSKRFKEMDDLFSDMDEDDEDGEDTEVKKQKQQKKKIKYNNLTRREKINLFNSLRKAEDDPSPLKDSQTGKVVVHRSGGIVEKVGDDSSSAGKKKAVVPRLKYKRNLRKDESEYVRGPYRFGSKALNKFNPYIMFNKQHRGEIKKLNPGVSNKELTKIVSQAWNDLEPAKKEKYQRTAAKLREELAEKLKEGKEVTNSIKRPPNAYLIFQSENMENFREEARRSGEIKDLSKVMSTKWKNLPEEEKSKYQLEAKKLRDEYYEKYGDVHKLKMELTVKKIQAKRSVTIANKLNKTITPK